MAEYGAVPPPVATPEQDAKIQEALARAKQVVFLVFWKHVSDRGYTTSSGISLRPSPILLKPAIR